MSCKTQQHLASETQEERAVRLENVSSQKNLLVSETTLVEKAARLEQVSAQKNNVLTCHTVQMHTPVIYLLGNTHLSPNEIFHK